MAKWVISLIPNHLPPQLWVQIWTGTRDPASLKKKMLVLLGCPFVPEISTEGHLRFSFTSKTGKSRYDLHCIMI
jgi:hypothetical protein